MEMNRVVVFLLLVALCVAVSSIHMSRAADRQYAEFEKMAQSGDAAGAEFGFRNLAAKYPFTPAGINAAMQIVKSGESPVRLVLEILTRGIRNTSAGEWLVLISAFLVITVFMGRNSLPSYIAILFIFSGAGIFHLSHPLVSIDSIAFETILAANPYIYFVLTLLLAGGYLHRRWKTDGQMAYHRAFVRGNLTLGDQLLVKEIYSNKLNALQEEVVAIQNGLQTAYGQHFAKEVKRVNETMLKELEAKKGEMDSTEAQHLKAIQAAEEEIDRAKQELLENKIRFKSTAIDRRDYNRIRLEKNSILKKSKLQIAEIKATIENMKKISFENRLQFMRRDLFLVYLHGAFTDRRGEIEDLTIKNFVFHPKIANENIKKRKVIYRNSSDVGGRLLKLEKRRFKIKDNVYNDRLESLVNEKKVIDQALMEWADKISDQMENCRNQIEKLEDAEQALQAELEDMKALKKIRNCFPAHVRASTQKIRQGINVCRKTLPVLRKIERIYSETQD